LAATQDIPPRICVVLPTQSKLAIPLEPAGDLGIETHDVERLMGAGSDDRDSALIGQELYHVQCCALFASAAGRKMLDSSMINILGFAWQGRLIAVSSNS
jgi:hypothetical protein